MNGGMNYPSGFHKLQSRTERLALATGRRLADFMNRLFPESQLCERLPALF
jgi:hypothetical protein